MPLLLPECKMTFVCGPVASGKTHLIKTWLTRDNRHVIFDSTGEYSSPGENEEIWANPKLVNEKVKANPYFYKLVYVPGRDRTADFCDILNILWWEERQQKLLVCDEVADICPVDALTEEIEMLLRFARKAGLGFLAASQRIADVHKLFTGGCRMVVLFQTNEARDLIAIDQRWRCADMVENLRPLLYNDTTRTTEQIPQAVVIEKGKKPYVWDFKTDARGEAEGSGRISEIEEDDSGEPITELPESHEEEESNAGVSELPSGDNQV